MVLDQTIWQQETLRTRRGHNFYPEAEALAAIPPLYATEALALQDKIVHLHYFAGESDWWIAELDPETGEGFGYARLGGFSSGEWGYVALPELEQVHVSTCAGDMVVERDLGWTPRLLP